MSRYRCKPRGGPVYRDESPIDLALRIITRSIMAPFTKTVFMLILNRMRSSGTPAFRQAVSVFILLLCALPGVGPASVVEQLEAIQPR